MKHLFLRYAGPSHDTVCHGCGKAEAQFRCKECWQGNILCKECLCSAHANNPFHFIEKWVTTHFTRCSLQSMGLILHFGHHGLQCPSAQMTQLKTIRVINVNGIQDCNILYCKCPDSDDEVFQLIQNGLFPASTRRPRTACTLHVLQDFHVDTTCSHVTAYDYVRKLEHLTNRIAPKDVPVCIAICFYVLRLTGY